MSAVCTMSMCSQTRVERLVRVGQGQKIVEESALVRRPGQMLGDDGRLIALGHAREPCEVGGVQRSRRADRQADAVQRERVERADRLEPPVRRTARAHVVLGVDLEEAESRAAPRERRRSVRALKPTPTPPRARSPLLRSCGDSPRGTNGRCRRLRARRRRVTGGRPRRCVLARRKSAKDL